MAIRWARAGLGRAKQRPRRRARGRVRSAAHREQYGERCFRRPTAAHNGRALLSTKQKQPSPVSVTLMGLSSRAPQAVQSIPRPLKAPQAVLSTPLRDAQDGLGMLQTVSRCFPTARRRQRLPRRAPPCLPVRGFGRHDAGSGIMPGVRGTGRGHSPRRDGQDPGQTGKTPSRVPRRPPIGEGFTRAHTVHTPPPPHLRTRARVADVPPGRVGNPKTRPQPQDTSTTKRIPRSGDDGPRPMGRRGRDPPAPTPSSRFRHHRNDNPVSNQHTVPASTDGRERAEGPAPEWCGALRGEWRCGESNPGPTGMQQDFSGRSSLLSFSAPASHASKDADGLSR